MKYYPSFNFGRFDLNSFSKFGPSGSNGYGWKGKIWGSLRSEELTGSAGSDRIYGFSGNDTIDGREGADLIYGGHGDDVITGGKGNDRIYAGHGDDEAIFVASENIGNRDRYDGGRGDDTITLSLTAEQYKDVAVQAEITAFLDYLERPTGHGHHKWWSHQHHGRSFTFDSLGLTISKFENLKVLVGGREVDPIDLGATASDDFRRVGEDDGVAQFATVLANDDVPNGIDSVRLVAAPHAGHLIFNPGTAGSADGSFSFDPAGDFDHLAVGQSQFVTFVYEVTDVDGDTTQGVVEITVTGSNDTPSVAAALLSQANEDGASYFLNLLQGATDVDEGATLSVFNIEGLVDGVLFDGNSLTIDPADAAFQSLGVGDVRDIVINYDVVDEHGASAPQTATIRIVGQNDTPLVAADINEQNADLLQIGNVLDNDTDIDANDVLSVVDFRSNTGTTSAADQPLQGQYGILKVFSDGHYEYEVDQDNPEIYRLPQGNKVSESFTYTVTDGAASTTAALTLTVVGINTTPEASDDFSEGVEDGNLLIGNVGGNDVDPDVGAVLSFAQQGEALSGFELHPDGKWSFDPSVTTYQHLAENQTLDVVVGYIVTDEKGAIDTAVLTITLTGTNDAPMVDDVFVEVTGPLEPVTLAAAASDPDTTDVLSYFVDTSAQTNGEETFGTVTNNGDGTFGYVSNLGNGLGAGVRVTDSFTYTAVDEAGAEASAIMTVQITGVNDDPIASAITVSVTELDDVVRISNLVPKIAATETEHAVYASAFSDPDVNDTLTLSVDAEGAALGAGVDANGGLTFDLDGRFDALRVGESETVMFSYTVTDSHGASASSDVTVIVNGVNRAATTVDDVADGLVGTTLAGNVLANDFDADAFDSETLTVSKTIYTLPEDPSDISSPDAAYDPTEIKARASLSGRVLEGTYGALMMEENGDWSYEADTDNTDVATLMIGSKLIETFTYEVVDGGGAISTGRLTIDIDGTYSRPVLTAQSARVSEDVSNYAFDLSQANTDSDAGETLSYALEGDAPEGVSIASDGTVTFDTSVFEALQGLDDGETADITLDYRATNSKGASEQETLVLTVDGANDGPEASEITASIWTQSAGRTLTSNISDVDGDALTVSLDTTGTIGTVTNNGDGTFFYDPNGQFDVAANQSETDTFEYTVSDGTTFVTKTATISIKTDAPPDGYDQRSASETTKVFVGGSEYYDYGVYIPQHAAHNEGHNTGISTKPSSAVYISDIVYNPGYSPGGVVNIRESAAGDFDGDGKDDLIHAVSDDQGFFDNPATMKHRLIIEQGVRNGGVVDLGTTGAVIELVTGDFDGDGRVDYATIEGDDNNYSLFVGINNGANDFTRTEHSIASFEESVNFGPSVLQTAYGAVQMELASGDFNGDGIDDLAVFGGRSAIGVAQLNRDPDHPFNFDTERLVDGIQVVQSQSELLFGEENLANGMSRLDITDSIAPFSDLQTDLVFIGAAFDLAHPSNPQNLDANQLNSFATGLSNANRIRVEAGDLNGDGVDDILTSAEGYGWSTNILNGARNPDETVITRENHLDAGHRGAVIADIDDTGLDDVVSMSRDGTITIGINAQDGSSTLPVFVETSDKPLIWGNPESQETLVSYDWQLDQTTQLYNDTNGFSDLFSNSYLENSINGSFRVPLTELQDDYGQTFEVSLRDLISRPGGLNGYYSPERFEEVYGYEVQSYDSVNLTVTLKIDDLYNLNMDLTETEVTVLGSGYHPIEAFDEFTNIRIGNSLDANKDSKSLTFVASVEQKDGSGNWESNGSNVYRGFYDPNTGKYEFEFSDTLDFQDALSPDSASKSADYISKFYRSKDIDADLVTELMEYRFEVTGEVREGQPFGFALDVVDLDSPKADIGYELISDTSLGSVSIDQDTGEFTWNPGLETEYLGANESIELDFVYRPFSVTGGAPSYGNETTVTLVLTGENDAPVAEDVDAGTVNEFRILTGEFAATDIDASDSVVSYHIVGEDEDGRVRITDISDPALDLGYVLNHGNGTFTIYPGSALERYDTRDVQFEYYAVDESGTQSENATVSAEIEGEWNLVEVTETFSIEALDQDTGTNIGLTLDAPDLIYRTGSPFDAELWGGVSSPIGDIPGASISGEASFGIGLIPTFDISPGEIDATFDVDVTTYVPPALVAGEKFGLRADWSTSNEKFDVEAFDFDIGLDLYFALAATLDYDFFGEVGNLINIDIEETVDLLGLFENLMAAKNLYSGAKDAKDANSNDDESLGTHLFNNTVEIANQEVGQVELFKPEAFEADGFAANQKEPFEFGDTQRIADFKLDLDAIMSAITGVPLSVGFEIGNDLAGAEFGIDLFDLDLNFGFDLTQDYSFAFQDMDLLLEIEGDDQVHEIRAGEYYEFELVDDFDFGDVVDYEVSYDPRSLLSTVMSLGLDTDIEFTLLGVEGAINSPFGDLEFEESALEETIDIFEFPNFATLIDTQIEWDSILEDQLDRIAESDPNSSVDLNVDITTAVFNDGGSVDVAVLDDPWLLTA